MSSFAILRLRKRRLPAAAAMARHALREDKVTNADPARAADNERLVGADTAAAVIEGIRKAVPEKRRKDAVTVVEFLVSASPEAIKVRDAKAQRAYFVDALHWLADRFGGRANVHLAVLHRDESTPHMQVLLTPLVDGKLVANKLIGGPAGLRQLQTDFARDVGAKHGLVRGIESKPGEERPSYQSIRRWYSAIAAAGGVDRIPPARKVPAVPDAPEAPGMLAGKAKHQQYAVAKAAHAKALKERQEAIAANRERQKLIEQLAKVGAAVYGRQARAVGERLAKADQAEARTRQADAVLAKQRDQFNERNQVLATLDQQITARREVLKIGAMEAQAEQLRAELAELQAAKRELAPRAPRHR